MSQLISITSLSSDVTFASGRREDREEEEGDLHGKMASPTFETLLAMNVPHILEAIFFSLDYKSFKRCMDVCVAWNVLLKSKAFTTKAKYNFTHDIRRDQEKLQYAASVGNTMGLLPVVARLLFGPFPVPVVLVIYYLFRVIIIFAVSILTIKMVLMSAFLVDFEIMSGKNFSC